VNLRMDHYQECAVCVLYIPRVLFNAAKAHGDVCRINIRPPISSTVVLHAPD